MGSFDSSQDVEMGGMDEIGFQDVEMRGVDGNGPQDVEMADVSGSQGPSMTTVSA